MPNASASEITISSGETEVMFSKKLDLKMSLNVMSIPPVFNRTGGTRRIWKTPAGGVLLIEANCG